MNERFVRKQLFQIGQFYQINSFNPEYLDKTGELIAKTEGRCDNLIVQRSTSLRL